MKTLIVRPVLLLSIVVLLNTGCSAPEKQAQKVEPQETIVQDKPEEHDYRSLTKEQVIEKYFAIPPKYDYASNFEYGYAGVKVNNKWAIIDKKGNYYKKPIYDYITPVFKDVFLIKDNDQYGFIEENNNIIMKPEYEDVSLSYEGLLAVKIKDKWGFIDKSLKLVIPSLFDNITWFKEGLAVAQYGIKYGFLKYPVSEK